MEAHILYESTYLNLQNYENILMAYLTLYVNKAGVKLRLQFNNSLSPTSCSKEIDKNKEKPLLPHFKKSEPNYNFLLSFLVERIKRVASESAEDKTSASQLSLCLYTLLPPNVFPLEVILPLHIAGKEVGSQ